MKPLHKRIQTDIVKVMAKSTGPSNQASSAQASPSTKSACLKVDTKCTSHLPLQGLTGSEVWVASAIDYITINDTNERWSR